MKITARQLSGEHIGKMITVHHYRGTYTGELDSVQHHRETESISHFRTETSRWARLQVGAAELDHVPEDTPITIREEP